MIREYKQVKWDQIQIQISNNQDIESGYGYFRYEVKTIQLYS